MHLNRVYCATPLTPAQRVTLRGNAAGHISRVLRLRVGEQLTLFDGTGGEHSARIDSAGGGTVTVTLLEHCAVERESPLMLTLAQGISRGERMDWVVQKATELGVTRISPLLTERSVVRLDAQQALKKHAHWSAVCVAACEQCGRNRLPELQEPQELPAFLADPQAGATKLLLSPEGQLRLQDLPRQAPAITVLIGPEGGLAPAEQAAAIAAGFTPVRLGPRVLRTETAAVAALAIIQREFGDL